MTDENDDLDIKQFRKPSPFFEQNRNLFTNREAYRKQLERRQSNGLLTSGAIVETSLGPMIDPGRFRAWLLQPVSVGTAGGGMRQPLKGAHQ